ncbi:MAG: glycosyltransferase family 4 protein [Sphingomonas sp.]|nr:glycosyltransferase family 4 protein [Sphingomonas sp.]
MSKKIVLSANSDWNIANFRAGLIRGLRGAGYEPVVMAPQDTHVGARIRELGVEQISVSIDRSGVNPLADLRLLAEYRRVLKRLRPAAYLGYTIKPNIYGSYAAASLGIAAFPNVSGLGTAFIRNGLLQQLVTSLYRIGFRRAPVVFFQNDEDRELFTRRRIIRPDQARVLPGSGVDLARFTAVRPASGPPVFLFVGRLLRDKGVVEFLDAARSLRDVLPDARFQLLGQFDEGNRTAISRSEVESWVSNGDVEYLGTTDDVRPAIAASSAVVLPSYREGLPRSLLEAGAMSRPLVATDVPGCRDVVEDGINGYLCAVRDARSLAAAMRRMAELPQPARLAMGKAARRKIQDEFSEERVISAYLEALEGSTKVQAGS